MTLTKHYRKIQLFYFRYKGTVYFQAALYGLILVTSVLLITLVVLPQMQNLFSVQQEVQRTKEHIATMEKNIAFLTALDEEQLDSDFSVATTALPPDHDVSLLVTAINSAANDAGVILDDFTFSGGQQQQNPVAPTSSLKTEMLTFSVQGTPEQIFRLITALQEKVPLLNLSKIQAQFKSSNSSQVTISYYAEALPLIREDDTVEIPDLSTANKALLQQLQSWQVPTVDFSDTNSSVSAVEDPL